MKRRKDFRPCNLPPCKPRAALLKGDNTHQHHFEERAVFVGGGVRAVGANETNTHGHAHTSEHNR